MNHEQKENLRRELMEHLFDCAEHPEALQKRIESEPEVAALFEEVRAEAGIFSAAARESTDWSADPRTLDDSPSKGSTNGDRPGRIIAFFRHPMRAAAAVLLAATAAFFTPWGFELLDLQAARASTLRVVLSGPSGIPDGAPARFHVATWDADGQEKAAVVDWQAFDDSKNVVASGRIESKGSTDIEIPQSIRGVRTVVVKAADGDVVRDARLDVSPEKVAVLAHLTCDKPIYRPGEIVYLRGVFLDRLSLAPRQGGFRLRIVDAKNVAQFDQVVTASNGIVAMPWSVPADASGGRYAFELRDQEGTFTVERREFVVRAFQPARFEKKIDLDRESYRPGEKLTAKVTVKRGDSNSPAVGAMCRAALIVDGQETWTATNGLTADGTASFSCDIPKTVERGEARFSITIDDAGVIENDARPFVIPTGKVIVKFYAEGGDLVLGVENRVYFEAFDALDRPLAVSGKIKDDRDTIVAEIGTLHQNRGRTTFTPSADRKYRFYPNDSASEPIDLPEVKSSGVVLRARADGFEAGTPIQMSVFTKTAGPWIAAAFCRGTMVGQTTWTGTGSRNIDLSLAPDIAGVLRVTVFDAALNPIAERLVHRKSGRSIEIELRPKSNVVRPGDPQEVEVVARDESGKPVIAYLGLTVTDKAVRDASGEHRVGLADQTWFVADAEELERVEEFLTKDAEGTRNIDLVLGTRGWRRFVWKNAVDLLAKDGEKAKALLAREGRSQTPIIFDNGLRETEKMREALRNVESRRKFAVESTALVFAIACSVGLILAVRRSAAALIRRHGRIPRGILGFAATACLLIVGIVASQTASKSAEFAERAPAQVAAAAAVEAPIAVLEPQLKADAAQWLRVLTLNQAGVAEGGGGADAWYRFNPNEQQNLHLRLGVDHFAAFNAFALVEKLEVADLVEEVEAKRKLEGMRDAIEQRRFGDRGFVMTSILMREFAHQRQAGGDGRSDLAETIYWNGALVTDAEGRAKIAFSTSDRITTWNVEADAHGQNRVGQGQTTFATRLPMSVEIKLPSEISVGDRFLCPVDLKVGDETVAAAQVEIVFTGPVAADGETKAMAKISGGRGFSSFEMNATSPGKATITIAASTGTEKDRLSKSVEIRPVGFPRHFSKAGVVGGREQFEVEMPETWVPGSLNASVQVFPSIVSEMRQALESLLAEPGGCFEQASSTNYPNVLVLDLLRRTGQVLPETSKRAQELLDRGYKLLTQYECKDQGYEWFGQSPAHESLSAYGLLEFADMAKVYNVDRAMVDRTRNWLRSRRDGEGGYRLNDRALDSFGRAPQRTVNAYCNYALLATGEDPKSMESEIKYLIVRAMESKDAYEVAVAALALAKAGSTDAARAARARLVEMQKDDGSLAGIASVTSSGGQDLLVETTAFAVLAWLEDPSNLPYARKAIDFIVKNRQNGGRFGATQATVMALKALCEFATHAARDAAKGRLKISVNGQAATAQDVNPNSVDPLGSKDLGALLKPGRNIVTIELESGELPYVFDAFYASEKPANSPEAKVEIKTTLGAASVVEGRMVPLQVEVTNREKTGQPMTIAVVGLPAGLEAPTKILDDLREARRFDCWEIRGRELVLYWRALAPEEKKEVTIDLLAAFGGKTKGAASRVWLYYTPELTFWAQPIEVEVTR